MQQNQVNLDFQLRSAVNTPSAMLKFVDKKQGVQCPRSTFFSGEVKKLMGEKKPRMTVGVPERGLFLRKYSYYFLTFDD